jgi:hypothetical protein
MKLCESFCPTGCGEQDDIGSRNALTFSELICAFTPAELRRSYSAKAPQHSEKYNDASSPRLEKNARVSDLLKDHLCPQIGLKWNSRGGISLLR